VSSAEFKALEQQVISVTNVQNTTLVPKVTELEAEVVAVRDETVVHKDEIARLAAQPLGLRVRDADGKVLGAFLGLASPDGLAHNAVAVSIRNEAGYLYSVPVTGSTDAAIGGYEQNGGLRELYYEDSGCAGQAYMLAAKLSPFGAANGFVFAIAAPVYLYVPAGSARTGFLTFRSSTYDPANCNVINTVSEAYAVYPNDPDVTGVANGLIRLPVAMQ
jgi:hypothetical protein